MAQASLCGEVMSARLAKRLSRRGRSVQRSCWIGFLWADGARCASHVVVFGLILVVAILLVVRNVFGLFFVGLTAALCLFIAARALWASQVFLFLQPTGLSVFSGGLSLYGCGEYQSGPMPSDVAKMSEALFAYCLGWFMRSGVGRHFVFGLRAPGLTRLINRVPHRLWVMCSLSIGPVGVRRHR